MSQNLDFDGFFGDLAQRLSDCLKQGHVPSGVCLQEVTDMLPDASDEFLINEILPRLSQYGLEMLALEAEEYLAPGTPEQMIGRLFLDVIRKKELDPDALYAMNIEQLTKHHPELFETLGNITFFAVPEAQMGMSCLQHTWRILRPTLKAEHQRLHPEKIADEEPWVDEETIEFLRPYIKGHFVPGWVIEKALRLLVIDLGSQPVSEDVLVTTLEALGVSNLPIAREYWLPNGSDETLIRMNLRQMLQACKVDVEAACRNGISAIPHDVLLICRNMVYFALESAEILDDAGFRAGQLLMEVLMQEREQFHPGALDEDDVYDPDEEMAQTLRTYAKGNLVPSWVVGEEYQRLIDKHHDIATVGGIRDATLEHTGLTSVYIEKDRYISPGTSQEDMNEAIHAVIRSWDLDRCYDEGKIPVDYDPAYQQIVTALYFGDPDFDTREQAQDYFMDVLMDDISDYRIEKHPDEVPQAGLDALESAVSPYCKYDLYPSFAGENAVRCIAPYVKHRWYAERLVWHLLDNRLDLGYRELPEEYYIEPDLTAEERGGRLADVTLRLNFDLPFIAENDYQCDDDDDKFDIFSNVIYFSDPDIEDDDEAMDEALRLLQIAAEHYKD